MKDTILEFTLNGRKHTFFRRFDFNDKPITTRIKENARKISSHDIPKVLKSLITTYGKDNIKDVIPIKDSKDDK